MSRSRDDRRGRCGRRPSGPRIAPVSRSRSAPALASISARMAIDQRPGAPAGGGVAGQPLAHHQGQDVGHRRGGAGRSGGPGPCAATACSQTAARLARTPAQRVGADRLDPRLLQRVVDLRALDRLRPQPGVGAPRRGAATRRAIWSARPRMRVVSVPDRSRGGCGRIGAMCRSGCGPSPEKTTSRSGCSASDRAAWASARLKISAGAFPLCHGMVLSPKPRPGESLVKRLRLSVGSRSPGRPSDRRRRRRRDRRASSPGSACHPCPSG